MVPLKITTDYSLLKSLIKIDDIILFLNLNHIDACAICDENLYGSIEFYKKCKKNNIKPIIGLDVILNNFHIYLYAKNYLGFKKLIKVNTIKNNNLNISDVIDDNILIIIPYKSLDLYAKFPNKENVYLGYQNTMQKKNVNLLSKNIVFVNDVRCIFKNDLLYLKYLNALGGNFSYDDNSYLNINLDNDDISLQEDFARFINIDIPFDKRYIPKFTSDSDAFLEKLAYLGLNKRCNGDVPIIYKQRMQEELKVIKQMGFVDYFLVVYDYVSYAKKNNILTTCRGSAVGSLVCYCLGISDIDPVKNDLLFARFLNPYRVKMPDIDMDFEDTKRNEIIEYVKNKYGKDRVALGLVFSTYKSKLILRDLAKLFKIDNSLFEKFIKNVSSSVTLKENMKNESIKLYLNTYPEYQKMYDIALHLEGLHKNISTHAAGVVICSKNLDDIIPVYDDGSILKTGIELNGLVEDMGLLKMDFLSLIKISQLSILLKKTNLKLFDIPLDSNKVYDAFCDGNTDDIFQFESSFAKDALRKLKPQNFNELCVAIAFLRPGPNNQMDAYIENKKTKNYSVHPALKDVLESTYGMIIYQEQIIKILQIVGKYSPYEADNIRAAISKKNEEVINKEESVFIKNAINNGYDEKFACDIFNQIKRFAGYGFNKSHSVSYAVISNAFMYLKVHYPIEFYLTLLMNSKDNESKKRYINSLKSIGVKLLIPSINYSTDDYLLKNNYLLLPLTMVKGINTSIYENIISKRDKGFKDIYDFFIKCQDFLDDKIYETLVLSGLLDNFKINRRTLLENYDTLFNYASLNDEEFEKPIIKQYSEYDDVLIRKFEQDYYGMYLGSHPCSVYTNVIKINNIKNYLSKSIYMTVLVENIKMIKTKKGEDMAFLLGSDETGEIEFTIFSNKIQVLNDIKVNDIITICGKPARRVDRYKVIVVNIRKEK